MVSLDRVSIVFGDAPERALPLMDQGRSREEIREATGQILGVHDCSLEVGEGEIAVLMGLSGSGKSTLIRAINGLNPIVRGSACVFDGQRMVDVGSADARTLRRLRRGRVAMVFQQFGLLPWRNVIDNVALGLELAGLPAGERRRRAQAQLDLVNLGEWAPCRMNELSGGMQQRVGLARAFATEAPILLMDEPFSALDPLIRNKLQDELLELQRGLRRTIVFVSHDLDEALKIGTRIAIMEDGRIVQLGTPQEIVLNPATDYVAEFVAHMNPLNVLRAAEIMERHQGEIPAGAHVVAFDTPVKDLMEAQLQGAGDLYVVKGAEPVGRVTQAGVTRALLGLERGSRRLIGKPARAI